MNTIPQAAHPTTAVDPCLQIQVDLSAMLDGELDAPSVRRVLVHSDVCPSCSMFLDGIRTQARAHADLSKLFDGTPLDQIDFDRWREQSSGRHNLADHLRQELIKNREQLARVLYELGRGFVLMGSSPTFYRAVAREPVPIPDTCMRGRNLLDEVRRLTPALADESAGREWVRARLLFEQRQSGSPAENLDKGVELLRETLMIRPRYHEARIYLGHAYHIQLRRDLARREFRIVFASADDLVLRAFALEHLGNVDLEEGYPERAIPLFTTLVESGAVEKEPRFYSTYCNLALCFGLVGEFDACFQWLARVYDDFPHKRRVVGSELIQRHNFMAAITADGDRWARFRDRFPDWFRPLERGGAR